MTSKVKPSKINTFVDDPPGARRVLPIITITPFYRKVGMFEKMRLTARYFWWFIQSTTKAYLEYDWRVRSLWGVLKTEEKERRKKTSS